MSIYFYIKKSELSGFFYKYLRDPEVIQDIKNKNRLINESVMFGPSRKQWMH